MLSAGAILTGFSGTFLQFRIQREANYYRQPVLSYVEGAEQGKAQDVPIGLVHFTGAFLLIIVSTLMAVTFGFVFPLLALAQMEDIEEMRTGDDRSMPPRAWSLFALGLSALRKIFAAANPPQVSAFLSQLLSPKLPLNSLKSMAH